MRDARDVVEEARETRRKDRELLRDVADWFHGREGELMPRGDAIARVKEEFEVGQGRANRVISGLVGDTVDPVVQEVDGDEKKVGIIEYKEGENWYGYIHIDDVEGRKKRVVCAECVDEAEKDSEVAYAEEGTGSASQNADWNELERIVEEHIENSHSSGLAGVKTGATLLSGTTVGGNTVWHLGNDGAGSGLNADRLDGIQSDSMVKTGTDMVIEKGGFGPLVDSFIPPGSSPLGVGLDSDNCIWVGSSDDSIYKTNVNGDSLHQIPVASTGLMPKGMDVDSNGCIWYTGYFTTDFVGANNAVLRANPSDGSIAASFDPGHSASITGLGLGPDESIYIAYTTENIGTWSGSIFKHDQSGTELAGFEGPGSPCNIRPEGITVDENSCIWVANPVENSIYKLDQSGNVDSQIASPSDLPRGLGFSSSGSIWNADSGENVLYKIGKTRRFIEE